jgi:hypothetical protein
VALNVGVDAQGVASTSNRSGSLTLPAREGDLYVFGQSPTDEVTVDAWKTHTLNVAPHATVDFRYGPWGITPGLRTDLFLAEGSRQTPRKGLTPPVGFSRLEASVDPRIAVRYQASRPLTLMASAGTYHQAPSPDELSAVFGTPALGLSRALHGTTGFSLRLTQKLSMEVTGFAKTMQDLVVRSALETPKLARALVQNGEGRAYGAQLLVRQSPWKGFMGWASYTFSRSERRYGSTGAYRLFDEDQPHVLTVVASQELGPWTLGCRFRFASGSPRTPVVGSFYNARSDGFEPVFGAQNSDRLPDFYQLDARIDRSFSLGRERKAVLFLDVQNVTARSNVEDFAYSPDYTRRGAISGLPTVAVAGGRVEF